MRINNMPDWAKRKKYIVFRMVDGEAWFYDAWNDYMKAFKQCMEPDVRGHIVPINEINEAF